MVGRLVVALIQHQLDKGGEGALNPTSWHDGRLEQSLALSAWRCLNAKWKKEAPVHAQPWIRLRRPLLLAMNRGEPIVTQSDTRKMHVWLGFAPSHWDTGTASGSHWDAPHDPTEHQAAPVAMRGIGMGTWKARETRMRLDGFNPNSTRTVQCSTRREQPSPSLDATFSSLPAAESSEYCSRLAKATDYGLWVTHPVLD